MYRSYYIAVDGQSVQIFQAGHYKIFNHPDEDKEWYWRNGSNKKDVNLLGFRRVHGPFATAEEAEHDAGLED